MINANIPAMSELPSVGQLIRSTVFAFVVAVALLVTTILPAEYAVDPTGIGRLLGLTQMGEIKQQLAEEAALERVKSLPKPVVASISPVDALPVSETNAAEQPPQAKPLTVSEQAEASSKLKDQSVAPVAYVTVLPMKTDTMTLVLRPGEPAEIKLEMNKGAVVEYLWNAKGGKLNFDTHGDPYNAPRGFYHGHGKGRFQPGDQGELKAAFDGKHGWFWRNRTQKDVTLILEVKGDYKGLSRVI